MVEFFVIKVVVEVGGVVDSSAFVMLSWLEFVGTEVVEVEETMGPGKSDCMVVPFETMVLKMTVRSLDVLFGSWPVTFCSSIGVAIKPDDVPLLESKLVASSSLIVAF